MKLRYSRRNAGYRPVPDPAQWSGFVRRRSETDERVVLTSMDSLLIVSGELWEFVAGVLQCFFAGGEFHVVLDHHGGELFDGCFWFPAEFFFGFGCVAQEKVDFCGAEVAWVELDMVVEVEAYGVEGHFCELSDGDGAAGGDDIVVCFWHLEHHPHHFDIVACEAPVSFGVEVSEVDLVLHAEFDAAYCAGDLAGNEGFASAW